MVKNVIGYFITRWRFYRSFEPDGDGFIYRRTGKSAGIRISIDEHAHFIRQFRRDYWKSRMTLMAGSIAILILTITPILLLGGGSETSIQLGGYLIALGLFLLFLFVDRRLLDGPARALDGRIPADSERTWMSLHDKWIKNASWTRLVVTVVTFVVLTGLCLRSPAAAAWPDVLWTAGFGLGSVLATYNAWRKYELGKQSIGPDQ